MESYVGQLLLVPYNFAPEGWALCNGQLLPISQYDVLFQLIGTTYGGDGINTFALPDLRGRNPVGMGQGPGRSNYVLGQTAGVETVTLTVAQMPTHSHVSGCSANTQSSTLPNAAVLAAGPSAYTATAPNAQLAPSSISSTGGSIPHNNLQPYLTMNWIISLFGIYPSQS